MTRKKGETIIIGNNIKITVFNISGNGVRIGVDAPADIAVYRQEIFDKIQQEKSKSGK